MLTSECRQKASKWIHSDAFCPFYVLNILKWPSPEVHFYTISGLLHVQLAIFFKFMEPKTGKRIPKFLTEMEIEHLREACCTPMEKALFEFMFSTGCRIGEIVSLDSGRINWSNPSAIIRGKGDKEREVYFNIRCEIWLKRYLDNREDRDTAIFVTGSSSNKHCPDAIHY